MCRGVCTPHEKFVHTKSSFCAFCIRIWFSCKNRKTPVFRIEAHFLRPGSEKPAEVHRTIWFFAFFRYNTLPRSSAAAASRFLIWWLYTSSVVEIWLCPSRWLTVVMLAPLSINMDAEVCRSLCREIFGRSLRAQKRSNHRETDCGWIGSPLSWMRTYPVSFQNTC